MTNVELFSQATPGFLTESYDASDQLYLNYLTTMSSVVYCKPSAAQESAWGVAWASVQVRWQTPDDEGWTTADQFTRAEWETANYQYTLTEAPNVVNILFSFFDADLNWLSPTIDTYQIAVSINPPVLRVLGEGSRQTVAARSPDQIYYVNGSTQLEVWDSLVGAISHCIDFPANSGEIKIGVGDYAIIFSIIKNTSTHTLSLCSAAPDQNQNWQWSVLIDDDGFADLLKQAHGSSEIYCTGILVTSNQMVIMQITSGVGVNAIITWWSGYDDPKARVFTTYTNHIFESCVWAGPRQTVPSWGNPDTGLLTYLDGGVKTLPTPTANWEPGDRSGYLRKDKDGSLYAICADYPDPPSSAWAWSVDSWIADDSIIHSSTDPDNIVALSTLPGLLVQEGLNGLAQAVNGDRIGRRFDPIYAPGTSHDLNGPITFLELLDNSILYIKHSVS